MAKNVLMPKEDRKQQVLHLLADTELALPPTVIYVNLKRSENITYSYKTVHRLLRESLTEGLLMQPSEKDDYYAITDLGRDYLKDES